MGTLAFGEEASSEPLKPWNDSVNQPLWAFALHKNKKELFSLCCTRINTTLLYCTRINTIQPHHRLWQRVGSYGFRLSITASTIIVIVAEIGHEWNQLHSHIIVKAKRHFAQKTKCPKDILPQDILPHFFYITKYSPEKGLKNNVQ